MVVILGGGECADPTDVNADLDFSNQSVRKARVKTLFNEYEV